LLQAFPNPASAITCIPLDLPHASYGQLYLTNAMGQKILDIHSGNFTTGKQKYFLDAQTISAGAYLLTLAMDDGRSWSQHLMVR
jgi:hypothetical protein